MKRFEGDPTEALRSADPLDPQDVPQDTTVAHARALFEEVTSMDTKDAQQDRPAPTNRRWVLIAAPAAVAAVAIVAIVSLLAGSGTAPEEHIAGGEPIASAAMCVELYDLNTLANREVAFDGTLVAIDGSDATFDVHRWFRGGSGEEVTLDADGLTGITSLGPGLELSQRYLVSGSGGFVWACGFTMTYDTDVAGQWATVFGS